MGCPKLCWGLDNRENCSVIQPPPDAPKPGNAVGEAPHIVLQCQKCDRMWWRWSIRDNFARLSQRWYIIKREKSRDGIQQHHNLDG